MKAWRTSVLVVLCTLAMASFALAAPPAAAGAKALPAAEPVLKVVPAGTIAYAVINNIKTGADDIDKFLKQIGASEMLKDEMPSGVLKALLAQAQMGEGFNPNGGAAIALLDPNAFGIDLIKMMKSAMPGAAASQPAAAPMPPMPVVVFLPGAGVKEVLGKFNPVAADPYMKLNLGGVELFAAPVGSYVLVSPSAKALEAVAKAPKKADDELKGRQAQVVRGSILAVRLNLKAAYPILQKAVKALDLVVSAKDEGLVDFVPGPIEAYKQLKPMLNSTLASLAQVDDLAFGLRIAETGVVMDAAVGYLPDSALGKAVAAFKAAEPPLMDSLPGQQYVMAITTNAFASPEERDAAAKNIETLLDNPDAKIPAEQKGKIVKFYKSLIAEIEGVGFVMNGAPADAKGIMSFALVIKGKDSQKIKGLLAEGADLAQDLIKTLGAGDADVEGVKVTYDKDVEKADGVSYDTITLKAPQLEDGMFSMVFGNLLGETGIAPLVAAPDKSTVVVTFGGGAGTLSRAIKAAQGKQEKNERILAQKETAETMKFMPKNGQALFLMNVGNYFDVIMAGVKKMAGGEAPPIPFAFTCKTPVALGVGVEGSSQIVSVYVPTEVIKEIVGFVGSMSRGFGGGPGRAQPAKPVPGGEEF